MTLRHVDISYKINADQILSVQLKIQTFECENINIECDL